jgi:FixJ family two-component response regulator
MRRSRRVTGGMHATAHHKVLAEHTYRPLLRGQMTTRQIIVLDDDVSVGCAIERMLKVHGFDAVLFECVEDFRDHANLDEAACLVLDINLNGASGIELSYEIARAGHSLPVIFVTGADSDGVRSAALKTGCVAYLTKPFTSALLVEAIEKSVRHGRPQ